MSSLQKNRSWRPSLSQEWLFKSAFFNGDEALRSWRNWKEKTHIENLDRGSQRLLPLVYKNLSKQGIEDEWKGRLKSVSRKTWYQNQFLFRHLEDLISKFQGRKIPTLLLKGVALTVSYYKDMSLRPMGDMDILVPREKAGLAMDFLIQSGWRLIFPVKYPFIDSYMVIRNATGFVHPLGLRCDLHWHVLKHACSDQADKIFWLGAVPVSWKNGEILSLNAADHLLEIFEHATYWSPVSPVRWIADVLTVLRSGNVIDWKRLEKLSKDFHLALAVREMLVYLKDNFGAPVPGAVIIRLKKEKILPQEVRLYQSAMSSKEGWQGSLREKYSFWLRYRSSLRMSGEKRVWILDGLQFLRGYWNMKSVWKIPWMLMAKILVFLGRAFILRIKHLKRWIYAGSNPQDL